MKFFSTNRQSKPVDFKEATIIGQAPDKGLYFPEYIPSISQWQTKNLKEYSPIEIAMEVMQPYVGNTIPLDKLEEILAETLNFPFPLVQVHPQIFSLELFHGPTLAFKDVGARFMSRSLGYFNLGNKRLVTVLVATSGDTGGAVANGFNDVEGVEVIILYPIGKVSPVQELQLTTCSSNVHALAVHGDFDDCQSIVKNAFLDAQLLEKYQLSSANSINVARWLPQQLYYFFALRQWQEETPPVISVPSGNFGNICAGLLAKQSGLEIQHFIAACNANDGVSKYLQNGKFEDKKTVACLSNAMDVAKPSNLVRILEIFGNSYEKTIKAMDADNISDDETIETIRKVFSSTKYILDPHGAVGYLALERYLEHFADKKGIFLETAHPIKFPNCYTQIPEIQLEMPANLEGLNKKAQQKQEISSQYNDFRDYMLSR